MHDTRLNCLLALTCAEGQRPWPQQVHGLQGGSIHQATCTRQQRAHVHDVRAAGVVQVELVVSMAVAMGVAVMIVWVREVVLGRLLVLALVHIIMRVAWLLVLVQ